MWGINFALITCVLLRMAEDVVAICQNPDQALTRDSGLGPVTRDGCGLEGRQ